MKRLLAGWLAVMLLFAAGITLAENTGEEKTVSIEESLISGEGLDPGSMAQNFRMVQELLKDEDVREILKNQDVNSVLSELLARTLVWMFRNRPVTMKILAELGVSDEDLQCIEKVWDSAERIDSAYDNYANSDDGKRLAAEYTALKKDPDVIEAAEDFRELATSEDLDQLLQALNEAVAADKSNDEMENGQLTQAVIDREVNDKSFVGALIIEIMQVLDNSTWAQKSVPKLAKNENLWRFLIDLANGDKALDDMLRKECKQILGDEKINAFLQKTLWEAHELYKSLGGSSGQETEQTTDEKTGEEVAQ